METTHVRVYRETANKLTKLSKKYDLPVIQIVRDLVQRVSK